MAPKISIIVPVYNAEKTLHKCIDSILGQSYKDWELLLIDDGSTDASAAICDEYVQRDKRVKVFHQLNEGVSSARNVGLDNAVGEWIIFVDSDDYINDLILSNIDLSERVDLYVFGVQFINRNQVQLFPPDMSISSAEFHILDQYLNKLYFTATWAKIYKRDIIINNQIKFNTNLKIGEDTAFVLSYLVFVEQIRFSSKIFYYFYHSEFDNWMKYALSSNEFIVHSVCIQNAFDDLFKKTNCQFSMTKLMLMKYYSHLFYIHLLSLKSYAFFREEILSYRKEGIIYYPKSFVNEMIMKVAKVFPRFIYWLFNFIR